MSNPKRTDSSSRIINATPEAIFEAFINPKAIASWRPPEGMTCEIFQFDPKEGGSYKMAFKYNEDGHPAAGKTTKDADVFSGRFIELKPGKRIVEAVDFESDDPAYTGTMILTTTFRPVAGGTEISILAEDVPTGIKPEDHQQGMKSSLDNLAKYVEKISLQRSAGSV